jgi:hypothetical protein
MSSGRFVVFLAVVLSAWALMHLYVFWRAASVPWVAAHAPPRGLLCLALALGASYPLGRLLRGWGLAVAGTPLEYVGATWLGVLFLMLSALVAVEVITLGGWALRAPAPALRGWALVAAGLLSLVGLAQGQRPPVVRDYEVSLAGLPPERDGLVLVALSDLHLGALTREAWMKRLVRRVADLRPDLVVVVGDVVDGSVGEVGPLLPVLQAVRAPLGVWAVTGNHEFYAGLERSVGLLEAAGYTVLRDRWVEVVPGLLLAGVDDLTAREQFALTNQPLDKALSGRPPGAVILLSHTPWQADAAAAANVGLMLAGHTHNGQIWPFNYLVRLRYPLMGGRYQIGGMAVIVCRGSGTWGPPMRLWRPNEILRVRLRAARGATNDQNQTW